MPKEKENEKTLKENLKDDVFVNYNLLRNLDELKKINQSILEILYFFYQKYNQEEKPKEEREGTFK